MIPLEWGEIEGLALGELRGRPDDGIVRRVHDDSRDARPGDLFVALNTGVRFVDDALAAGAMMALLDGRPLAEALLRHLHDDLLTGRYRASSSDLRELVSDGDYNCVGAAIMYLAACERCGLVAAFSDSIRKK